MKILVTGAAGFLGSWIAEALLADGHTVIAYDNLIGGEEANVPVRCERRQFISSNDILDLWGAR